MHKQLTLDYQQTGFYTRGHAQGRNVSAIKKKEKTTLKKK